MSSGHTSDDAAEARDEPANQTALPLAQRPVGSDTQPGASSANLAADRDPRQPQNEALPPPAFLSASIERAIEQAAAKFAGDLRFLSQQLIQPQITDEAALHASQPAEAAPDLLQADEAPVQPTELTDTEPTPPETVEPRAPSDEVVAPPAPPTDAEALLPLDTPPAAAELDQPQPPAYAGAVIIASAPQPAGETVQSPSHSAAAIPADAAKQPDQARSAPVEHIPGLPRLPEERRLPQAMVVLGIMALLLVVIPPSIYGLGRSQATRLPAPAVEPSSAPATLTGTPEQTARPISDAADPSSANATQRPRPTAVLSVVANEPLPAGETPGTSAPLDLQQQVALAEQTLRSGELTVTIDYGQGPQSSTRILFDLGKGQQPQRLHSITTYFGKHRYVIERIVIGGELWVRQDNAAWQRVPGFTTIEEYLYPFLPNIEKAASVEIRSEPAEAALDWFDAERQATLTLSVASQSGIPSQLQQIKRTTGSQITVTYLGWNTPVSILDPTGKK